MRRTFINKFTHWYLQHFLTIVMIPVTIFIFFIGIYGRVFVGSKIFSEDADYLKITKYIDFFEEQREIVKKNIPLSIDFQKATNKKKKYNHLLILDKTVSTINATNKILENHLRTSLNIGADSKKDSLILKDLFVMKVYQQLMKVDTGSLKSLYYVEYNGKSNFKTDTVSNIDVNNFLKSKKRHSDFYFRQNGQMTYLAKVFEQVNSYKDANTIVTIISDFVNDPAPDTDSIPDITPEFIEQQLQTGKSKPVQYNITYIVPDGSTDKRKSDSLVNLLKDKIHGTFQYMVSIQSDEKPDKNAKKRTTTLDLNLKQGFSPIIFLENDSTKIQFYYVRSKKQYKIAECKIIIVGENDTTDCFWKVTSPYPQMNDTKIGYTIGGEINKESRINIDEWRSVNPKDTLTLQIPYSPVLESNQYNLVIICGERCTHYLIEFKECIPLRVDLIAETISYVIVLLFIMLVFCWTAKHFDSIDTHNEYKNLKRKDVKPHCDAYSLKYLRNRNIGIFIFTLLFLLYAVWCNHIVFIALVIIALAFQGINFIAFFHYTNGHDK